MTRIFDTNLDPSSLQDTYAFILRGREKPPLKPLYLMISLRNKNESHIDTETACKKNLCT